MIAQTQNSNDNLETINATHASCLIMKYILASCR